MNWLSYLLEANLYLLAFYGFYFLLLKKETFYSSNRYYLLVTTVISFVLPTLQIGRLKPQAISTQSIETFHFNGELPYALETGAANPVTVFDPLSYLYPIYIAIVLLFAFKLLFSISKLMALWRKAEKGKKGSITVVSIPEKAAFSFFNLLFIHPQLAEEPAVLRHELVHIQQKHSVDILFFELLQLLSWFNPLVYLIQKEIKLLHEYIADELSTTDGMQKHDYAIFLIEHSFGITPIPLTNQFFNQSILKSRINMLNKKRTANWARLRLLLVAPLTGAMLCTSTLAFTKDYGYLDLLPEKSRTDAYLSTKTPLLQEKKQEVQSKTLPEPKVTQVKFPPPIVKKDRKGIFIPTPYRIKKTGRPISNDRRYILINGKPVEDLDHFYGISNADQINYLPTALAVTKYGDKGKYGAVEITGAKIKYLEKLKFPPPIEKAKKPQVERVNLPTASQTTVSQTQFTPRSKVKYNTKTYDIVSPDKRYIIINGTPVADMTKFYGVTNTESITLLEPEAAIKAYGNEKGKYGAVEIKGEAIKYLPALVGPPPNYSRLVLDRNKGELFKIPNTDDDQKSLTVYNDQGKIVYNSPYYGDNWDGKTGNYSEFNEQKIVPKNYTFLVKIAGKPLANQRGQLTIK